jgi:N,N'-diacetyllegionaminate synthase
MNKFYFYTETAFHHEGDMSYMKKLIDETKKTGAEGIKFQVMTKTSDFVSKKHTAFYSLDNYRFSLEEWTEIFKYTHNSGLDIVMMPLNLEAFKLLDSFEVKYLDIHSVSFNDNYLLEEIKKSEQNIILGVGGRTLEEIIKKINYFESKLKVLMVGFQSFPSQLEDVNIGKIYYLKKLFPDCLIGYADHSSFDNEHAITSNEYARLLGATFFEKHITLTEGAERIDCSAAVGKDKIKIIINKITYLEQNVLTDFILSFHQNEKEITYRNRQLICVAAKSLKKNTIISAKDIQLKLIDTDEVTFHIVNDLIGKALVMPIEKDCAFSPSHIQF